MKQLEHSDGHRWPLVSRCISLPRLFDAGSPWVVICSSTFEVCPETRKRFDCFCECLYQNTRLYLNFPSVKTHPVNCPLGMVTPEYYSLSEVNVNGASIRKTSLHSFHIDVGMIVGLHVNALDVVLVNEVHTWFVGATVFI